MVSRNSAVEPASTATISKSLVAVAVPATELPVSHEQSPVEFNSVIKAEKRPLKIKLGRPGAKKQGEVLPAFPDLIEGSESLELPALAENPLCWRLRSRFLHQMVMSAIAHELRIHSRGFRLRADNALCYIRERETDMSTYESCNPHEDVDDFYKNLRDAGSVEREMMNLFEQLSRRVALLGTGIARNHARDTLSTGSTEDDFRRSFETLVDFFTIFNQKEMDREKSREILMTAAMNGALDVFQRESLRVMKELALAP
jgi:hypothetical protein